MVDAYWVLINILLKLFSLQTRVGELEAKYRKEINRLEVEIQKGVSNAGIIENSSSTNPQGEKHPESRSELDSQSRSTEILLQEREDGEVHTFRSAYSFIFMETARTKTVEITKDQFHTCQK